MNEKMKMLTSLSSRDRGGGGSPLLGAISWDETIMEAEVATKEAQMVMEEISKSQPKPFYPKNAVIKMTLTGGSEIHVESTDDNNIGGEPLMSAPSTR